jgi:hypothetical protein
MGRRLNNSTRQITIKRNYLAGATEVASIGLSAVMSAYADKKYPPPHQWAPRRWTTGFSATSAASGAISIAKGE